jgi:flagellar biogenesis protein FliO
MVKRRFGIIYLSLLTAAFALADTCYAITTLKQVQVTSGSQVDLLFDGRVGKNQVRTEFFNDIVQVVLTDAAVYPAKISSVRGGQLLKIFAYQYAPKLVRCRFTVKGKAEDLKDKLQVTTNGKLLTVRFLDGTQASAPAAATTAKAEKADRPEKASAPAAARAEGASASAQSAADSANSANSANSEEKALLDKVTSSSAQAVAAPAAAVRDGDKPLKLSERDRAAPIAGGKPMPGIARTMGKLLAVVALFFILAMGAKKLLARGLGGSADVVGKLGNFARKKKMIEMVSSYHLGPKKSINVVRIGGRTLVLGVTQDSINLITQLAGDTASDEELEELMDFVGDKKEPQITNRMASTPNGQGAGPSVFSSILGAESAKPLASAAPAPASDGARSRIRSRLEGLKQL